MCRYNCKSETHIKVNVELLVLISQWVIGHEHEMYPCLDALTNTDKFVVMTYTPS